MLPLLLHRPLSVLPLNPDPATMGHYYSSPKSFMVIYTPYFIASSACHSTALRLLNSGYRKQCTMVLVSREP